MFCRSAAEQEPDALRPLGKQIIQIKLLNVREADGAGPAAERPDQIRFHLLLRQLQPAAFLNGLSQFHLVQDGQVLRRNRNGQSAEVFRYKGLK